MSVSLYGNGNTVIQVQSANLLTTFSTATLITASGGAYTSTGAPVTGLSVSITPNSTNSKILVVLNLGRFNGNAASVAGGIVYRNSTPLAAASVSSRPGISFTGWYGDNNVANTLMWQYLDSPATTSALTYSVNIGPFQSGSAYVNQTPNDLDNAYSGRTTSSIVVMEISGS
jgi:hypothetical protein